MNSTKKRSLVPLCLILAFSFGCGLIPKDIELFQRKVKAVPTASPKHQEIEKQAAAFTSQKIEEARFAAAKTDADVSVQGPLSEASPVALSLSYSLGMPSVPWTDLGTNLSLKLNKASAGLDHDIDKYAQKVQKDEGKKIEGSGLIKIGYFSYVAILFGLAFLVWTGLKIYGMVNPIVGAGTNIVGRVGSKVLSKGMAQVVSGGEKFKELLADNFGEDQVKQIKELFNQAHERSHDNDVKDLIRSLTK